MPKALTGYNEATVTSFKEREKLPTGGYILKILDVKEEEYSWGSVIVLRFDIAEGEYKGFFQKQYNDMSDEYKKWKGTHRMNVPSPKSSGEDDMKKYKRQLGFFKSQIKAFEDSNNGLHIDCEKEWDVSILKGKTVGAVFGNQEYYNNGKSYWFTALDHLLSVSDIRNGEFKIPEDREDRRKPKNGHDAPAEIGGSLSSDFETIAEDVVVPF